MLTARSADGALMILADDGRPLARVGPAQGAEAGFDGTAAAIAAALATAAGTSAGISPGDAGGAPRVVVSHREGLLESACADRPCDLHLIEEDRYGEPPLLIRLRALPASPDGVAEALRHAEARKAVRLHWAP